MINDDFFENLPFSYFSINNDLQIINRSIVSTSEFPIIQSFRELMEPSQRSLINELLSDLTSIVVDLSLLTIKEQYTDFRVYLYKDITQLIHVFVFPICHSNISIETLLDKIEAKFSHFKHEIEVNKKYIDETVSDFQEASMANQQFQNVEKLAAGIAHEIRNPLTTVSGFLQLLKPYLIEIGKEQYAEIALEELQRANQIIYEFLNASKPIEVEWKPISLNKLVRDTNLLYESEAILKNISIVTHYAKNEIEIIGNHKQLKQVLINLIKNAMEAIEMSLNNNQKGVINFYTEIDNQKVSIVVKDNGCGMNEKTINQIFLPFHTTKETGTGVGLNVCKNIIEEHHGLISVESEVGFGTIFRIEFPINIR